MVTVNGTKGYSEVVDRFIDAADAVDFATLHRSYSALIPSQQARVLDVGAGTGRDAAVFAGMGHEVVAVEPMYSPPTRSKP
ncbi:MAG: 2-polyprenyl-3-methyl-5-hydroxy-6-metoxy-1,4-benzoquinol methylase [Candidatus Azotimanducaceae bacterium]|jgi:2-polyprenyl-3-methyl-5-hydroxy-6-metoxy-1,4-benzoquinol methylase